LYFDFNAEKLGGSLDDILHDLMMIERLKQMETTEAAVGHHDAIIIVRDACLKRAHKRKYHKISVKTKAEIKAKHVFN